MTKKFYMVLDTETAGNFSSPQVYDLSWLIMTRKGEIVKKESFVIKEIFGNWPLMQQAYYALKYPQYIQKIFSNEIIPMSFQEAISILQKDIEEYQPEIWAYNSAFDERALKATADALDVEINLPTFFDIWGYACQVLYRKRYVRFCAEMGCPDGFSEKGNIRTTAEAGYRFLTKSLIFEESHTALEDCYVESAILSRCLREKRPTSVPTGNKAKWKVYRLVKEMGVTPKEDFIPF